MNLRTARADLEYVRDALATGVLIRGEVAWSVAAVCDALAELLSKKEKAVPEPTYRLKSLEWVEIRGAGHEDGEWWTASTVFGSLDVEHDVGSGYRWRYCFDEYYDEDRHGCESIAEGKVQAEAFYRVRILAALDEVTA